MVTSQATDNYRNLFFQTFVDSAIEGIQKDTRISKRGNASVDQDSTSERDRFAIDLLGERNIPTVIMTSGGYSKDSYKLVADLASHLVRTSS